MKDARRRGGQGGTRNAGRQTGGRSFNGIGRDEDDQPTGANTDAVFGEVFTQALHGATHALLRGVFARAEGLADFTKRFVFEIAKQDGGAIGLVERIHGFVQKRFNVRPISVIGVGGVHFRGDLFPQLPAGFAADNVDGAPAGDLIEPRGQDRIWREPMRVAGQVGEGGLGDFLSQLRRAHLAQRNGVH